MAERDLASQSLRPHMDASFGQAVHAGEPIDHNVRLAQRQVHLSARDAIRRSSLPGFRRNGHAAADAGQQLLGHSPLLWRFQPTAVG